MPTGHKSNSYLFPVGGDDANVFGRNGGQALFAGSLQQFLHVVHQNLHLGSIEEGRAGGLALIDARHSVEDQWEVLPQIRHTCRFDSTSNNKLTKHGASRKGDR